MAKQTFYFSHDYNARNDEKILELRSEFGAEGYGIFWMLVETMAENENSGIKASLLGGLSLGFGVAKDRLNLVISKCLELKLFYEDDGYYFSNRLLSHKEFRKTLSENGKKGAGLRWAGDKGGDGEAIAPPMQSKVKETKGKEIKENEINIKKENKDTKDLPELNNVVKSGGLIRGALQPLTPPDVIVPELRFTGTDFDKIPEGTAIKLINALKVTKGIESNKSDLEILWDLFKETEIHKKTYVNREGVYGYFFTWAKRQFLKNTKFAKKKESILRPFAGEIKGLKFSEDFTHCEMEDGTLVKLTANQKDLAENNLLSPQNVKKVAE